MILRVTTLFLVIFLMVSETSMANQPDEQKEIEWYVYDDQYESYVPTKVPGNRIGFFLTSTMKGRDLVIDAPSNTAIFIENNLTHVKDQSSPLIVAIDSLIGSFGNDLFVVLYHKEALEGLQIQLRNRVANGEASLIELDRQRSGARDFFVFSIVMLLFLMGIARRNMAHQYPYIVSFRQLYLPQMVDSPIYSSAFFSRESIQFYVLLSLTLGLSGLYFVDYLASWIYKPLVQSFYIYIAFWLLYSGFVYLFFCAKFLLYRFFGNIYNFRKFIYIQNYDFMRAMIFSTLLCFVVVTLNLLIVPMNLRWFYIFLLMIHSAYLITSFRKLNKLYSHAKLHLFSYLCVSEIVPGLFFTGILG